MYPDAYTGIGVGPDSIQWSVSENCGSELHGAGQYPDSSYSENGEVERGVEDIPTVLFENGYTRDRGVFGAALGGGRLW